jgi:hypothetical protein
LNSIILLFRWTRFQRSYPSQPPRKVCDRTENNVNAAFDLAQKLVHAKDVSEVLALQSEFAKAQMAAMQAQAKELGAVAQDVIASATRK